MTGIIWHKTDRDHLTPGPSGEIEFTLRRKRTSSSDEHPSECEIINGTVQWQGNKIRTELSRLGPAKDFRDLQQDSAINEASIVDQSTIIHHAENSKVIIISTYNRFIEKKYTMISRIYWYKVPIGGSMAYTEMLGKIRVPL